MWLFTKRRKKQQPAVKPNPTIVERDNEKPEKMKPVPASLAAEYDPESRFIIKKIKQRNPEAILVSLIATGVAAGVNPNSQFIIRKIAKK